MAEADLMSFAKSSGCFVRRFRQKRKEPGIGVLATAASLVLVALAFLLLPAITWAEPGPTTTPSPPTATAAPGLSYGSGFSTTGGSFAAPAALGTPTRLVTRMPSTGLRPLWALLPTPVASAPQPSAFFVPRIITATTGFGDGGGARLQGRVLDWRGNGMAGVALRALSERDDRSGPTRNDGTYLFEALPAGTYIVSVLGYEGIPAAPLPIDGQSTFIVEFMEGSRPVTPTASTTPIAVATPGQRAATPTVEARATASPTAAAAGLSRPPANEVGRPTATAKQEAPLLSGSDIDYLKRTWLTPFLLGAAGSYIMFLIGMFGARLRR